MNKLLPMLSILMLLTGGAVLAETAATPVRAIVDSPEQPESLTVLDRRGSWWLVEGTPAELSAWPDAKPVPVAVNRPAAARAWTPVKQADPLIQSLVDQVVWDDLLAGIDELVALGTRYSNNLNINVVADTLVAWFEEIGLPTEKRQFAMFPLSPYNVIATQTGAVHPDSVFVVCGHYDSTSDYPDTNAPGADDNGTGTVAVLTCARLFAPLQLDYTVKYVLFAGEEQIMVGSDAWVEEMAALGLNIVGAMNVDMIGWCGRDAPYDLEIETNAASRWMADAITNAADLYTDMPYVLHDDDSAWWGDFYSFWQHGFCAVNHEEAWDWYDPDFNPNYHTIRDTSNRLNGEFCTGNTRIVVAGLATLAGVNDVTAVEGIVAAPRPIRVSASPNPFNGRTALRLAAEGVSGRVGVAIFDVLGRRVGRESVVLTDGRGEVTWSATDAAGAPLATGVYLARVETGGPQETCRLVHVK